MNSIARTRGQTLSQRHLEDIAQTFRHKDLTALGVVYKWHKLANHRLAWRKNKKTNVLIVQSRTGHGKVYTGLH